MSQPGIPNIIPDISIDRDQSVIMLLSSIAREEMALAHIVNAGAEQVQYVLGTLNQGASKLAEPTLQQLLDLQQSTGSTLQSIILKEMVLLMKMDRVIEMQQDR